MSKNTNQLKDSILSVLRNRHFLKNENHVAGMDFEVEILLNPEASEVFIKHLNASGRLKHDFNLAKNPSTPIIINFYSEDLDFLIEDLEFAYKKAIQYLDYKDLRRDYAAGYVPSFASDWVYNLK